MPDSSTSSGKRITRILVVDDHPLVREGLAARISPQPDMEICGEAASLNEALDQVRATHPDLCIIDI
ncbi:MAG: response regulator transcription factor, partial [Planctomycetales bacterium]|nr:response regulator transcription factor [Planctomycetales bacterium]